MRILLFSAGLDSYMIWHLLDKPQPVYVLIDSVYEDVELQAIDVLEAEDDTLRVDRCVGPALGELQQADGHIPFRNLVFAVTAAAVYQPALIYLGALAGETSRDKSGKFLGNTSALLTYTERQPVSLVAPFRHLTKTELLRRFLVNFPYLRNTLLKTRSCYQPQDGIGCGACMACFRRWVAMSNNGIVEPYASPPWEWGAGMANRSALHYVFQARPSEWYGILRNNLDAARAIYRQQRKG